MSKMEERILRLGELAAGSAGRARGSWLLIGRQEERMPQLFPAAFFFIKRDEKSVFQGTQIHHHQEVKASVDVSVQVNNKINQTLQQNYWSLHRRTAHPVELKRVTQRGQSGSVMPQAQPVNPYQWYLHTSLLKDIRRSQLQLAGMLRQPSAGYGAEGQRDSIWGRENPLQALSDRIAARTLKYMKVFLFDTERLLQPGRSSLFQGRSQDGDRTNAWYPVLYFVTDNRSSSQELKSQKDSHYYSDMEIRKNIKVEERGPAASGPGQERPAVPHVNVDRIADQVYRTIEEKLRHERLRKGLL